MTNSCIAIISLGLAVDLTTTSVLGSVFTQGVPEVDNPTHKDSFTFIFKSEVEFATYVLRVAVF